MLWTSGWIPRTQPNIHILGEVKSIPIHILPIAESVPIHKLFFKFYPFTYFLSDKVTPFIYFWSENETHWYTLRPAKYTPFQPHICIYLYYGSWPPCTCQCLKLSIQVHVWIYNFHYHRVSTHQFCFKVKKYNSWESLFSILFVNNRYIEKKSEEIGVWFILFIRSEFRFSSILISRSLF